MTKHPPITETRIVLRTILSAGVLAVLLVLAATGVGAGAEWHVPPDESIQDAIDGAVEGDTIYVHEGVYVENVDVWKRVTLIGDGADVVTVRAADAGGHVFNVTADWVNVSGFAVAGAGYLKAGIKLSNGVDHCNISENNCSNNYYGIRLYESSENILIGNTADSNNDAGIGMWDSSNNTLANSAISNNRCGIRLSSSSGNTLTGNTANSNNRYGILLSYSSGNTLTGNTANSNNWGSSSYINNGRGGIHLWISCDNTLASNTASSNTDNGIHLSHSSGNTLESNTVNSNNWCGIHLWYSSNNMLTGNTANSNDDAGIDLRSSSNNTLKSNTMSGNAYNFGVYGSNLSECTQNMDTSNTVDGKPIYYWIDQKDRQIPSDAGFVGVVNGTNITVIDISLTNNIYGVVFTYTENSRIENVTASDNKLGISLRSSSNNTLVNNNLINNTNYNAYDTDTNQWDSGSEGNYYSDYTGTDNNTNNIGDTPYPIPGGESVDRYPLMQPWTDAPQRLGDLNHDGDVTPADAVITLRLAVTGAHDPAADVSGDDRITALDALMILQAAAGRIEL